MLNNDDLKWLAASSTELNAMLQQISRYSDLARQHKGEYNYIKILGERVELASKTAQSIFDRVTSKILEGRRENWPWAPHARLRSPSSAPQSNPRRSQRNKAEPVIALPTLTERLSATEKIDERREDFRQARNQEPQWKAGS